MSPTNSLQQQSLTHLLHSTLQDRITGVLIGSALGDTIGLYTEFLSSPQSKSSYPSAQFTLHPTPTPFHLDRHRAPFTPGHWTDDTDHAILLLLSFLHNSTPSNHVFPTQADLASRLRIWAGQGFKPLGTMPLGLGKLMGTVLMSKGFDAEPEKIAREHWEVGTKKMAAPNGSLMRTHPVGLMTVWEGEGRCFELAAEISRATHVDPRCVVACVVGSGLVRAVVRGEVRSGGDVDGVIGRGRAWYCESMGDDSEGGFDWDEFDRYCGGKEGLAGLRLDQEPGIGYVYKTLGAGVVLLRMAVGKSRGVMDRVGLFEELITELVMQGGDADTNACFAGALLGGYLGFASLPDHWKLGMVHGKWLVGKAESLCQILHVKEGEYNGENDVDTAPLGGRPAVSQQEMEARWMVFQQGVMRKMEEAKKVEEAKTGASNSKSGWSVPWKKPKK
ncbi:ADP-ribosylglycohydrolase-domain-containing protein [Triangularia verruculosa]|uniref:ADP-ribosylglycohydrolase-domain-containing protein n=1 Tax=Triangularia verruculosa TaxID=2587418 RepID=A0AAN7AVY8_9PEZI|nr:ADP-ribosylglycohydrolase-domain-containing protein [Triangularia verruculosa]